MTANRFRKIGIPGITILVLVVMVLAALGSCQRSYLGQAVVGHLKIMNSRESIEKLLDSNLLDSTTRSKLQLVMEIRDFAIQELHLPDNKSYTLYAEIEEDYPGWNVFCASQYSIIPKTWCYPIAGCVVYHGYFSKSAAVDFAREMQSEGLDVYVSPFTAYSTLGWFKDPILSNHLRYDSVQLAGLIIHEMAHQRLYKKNDSEFSEGFAVTVERAGVSHWLKSMGRTDQMDQAQLAWDKEDETIEHLLQARQDLDALYRSRKDTLMMQTEKEAIFVKLGNYLGRDYKGLNNATLVPISTYHRQLPKFQEVFDSCWGNFEQFYAEMEQLSKRK